MTVSAHALAAYVEHNPNAGYLTVVFLCTAVYLAWFTWSRGNVLVGSGAPPLMFAICFSYQVYILQYDTKRHEVCNWLCLPLGALAVCLAVSLWRWWRFHTARAMRNNDELSHVLVPHEDYTAL